MTSPGHIFLTLPNNNNSTGISGQFNSRSGILHQGGSSKDVELGLEFLFQTTSIVELKGLVEETRDKLQRNRDTLKAGIRDHYPDFLQVAGLLEELGTINYQLSPSPTTSESVLSQLDANCERIVHQEETDGSTVSEDPFIYSVASRVKLLVDAPEQIWSALETSEFLLAGQLSCLAERLYTSLMESTLNGLPVLSVFPIIKTQGDILRNARSSVAVRASQMLQSARVTNQELFDTLLAIFLVDKPSSLDLIKRFLNERTKSILSPFQKLPKQLELSEIQLKFHQLGQDIIQAIRDIYTCFISNGSMFFDTESYKDLVDHFTTPSIPTVNLTHPFHSNGSESLTMLLSHTINGTINGNLLLRWMDSDLFSDLFIWQPQTVSTADMDHLMDQWFTSLTNQLLERIQPLQSHLNQPHHINQLRQFLAKECQPTVDSQSKFSELLTTPRGLISAQLWQPFLLNTSLHTIQTFINRHQTYQAKLLDHLNLQEIDGSNLLWDTTRSPAPHHLSLRLSGQVPVVATVMESIRTNELDLLRAYPILIKGLTDPSERHQITVALQSGWLGVMSSWLDTIQQGLEASQHYVKDLQLVRCLEGLDPILISWTQHTILPSLSEQHHQTITELRERILQLVEVGFQPWSVSLATDFVSNVKSTWLATVAWDNPPAVPGHFITEVSPELGSKYHFPTQLSHPLMVQLHSLNTKVFTSLGHISHPQYVSKMLLLIGDSLRADLQTKLESLSSLVDLPVNALQFLFDYQFLYTMGCLPTDGDPHPPLTSISTQVPQEDRVWFITTIHQQVIQYRCQTRYVLGGLWIDDQLDVKLIKCAKPPNLSPLTFATPGPHLKLLKI